MATKKSKAPRNTSNVIVDEDGYEILGGSSEEMQIGEVVEGVFHGVVRTMAGLKKGTTVPFYQVGARQILGGTVLKNRIEEGKVKEGDMLKITRVADAKKKPGREPAKMYQVRVKRA